MVTDIWWNWFTGLGDGYTTVDVNIPPSWVGAQVSLHGQNGGGTNFAGIKHYRRRLDSGADQDVDFGDWPSWPPAMFDFASSITFAIATTADCEAWLVYRMDYWA
jgi:hypothetical protein